MFKKIILVSSIAFLTSKGPADAQEKKASRPNIIVILTDDLGYGNVRSFNSGARIATPNIDRMASEGMKFTRFYSGSTVCAPSRASLMTGYHMGHSYVRGNGNISLREQDTTLAQRLQNSGYMTGMFGKWGLGLENEPGAPQMKGFDEFYGYLLQRHAHYYYTDYLYEVRKSQLRKIQVDSTEYAAEAITRRALSFITENKDKPFFLYFSTTLPHAELRVPDSLMKPYLNSDGSSKLGPETPFIPEKNSTYFPQSQPHAAFAAMITKLDSDVGRIFSLLKQLGLDENTYVIFTSDNGPHREGGGDPDYFNSAGGLRGIKRDLYEGGIRVPAIVRAPANVRASTSVSTPFAFWDVMPTLCEITGTPVPGNRDGISFLPALQGKKQPEHKYLYWQFKEGSLYSEALLQGEWKLIRFKERGQKERLELYHIDKDPAEKNNISGQHPDRVLRMKALMPSAKTPSEHPKFDWSDVEQ